MKKSISKAFTLVELLVVISIISLLIAVLLPTLGSARATARGSLCLSDFRQIGQALNTYSNDWKNLLPPARPRTAGISSSQFTTSSATDFNYFYSPMQYLLPMPLMTGSKQNPIWICPDAGTNWSYMTVSATAPSASNAANGPGDIVRTASVTEAFIYRPATAKIGSYSVPQPWIEHTWDYGSPTGPLTTNGSTFDSWRSQTLDFYAKPSNTVLVIDGHQNGWSTITGTGGNFNMCQTAVEWGTSIVSHSITASGAAEDYLDFRHPNSTLTGVYADSHCGFIRYGDIYDSAAASNSTKGFNKTLWCGAP